MKLELAMVAIVTSLAALCGAAASADECKPPTEGRRVRVTAPGFAGGTVIGDLVAVEATRVTLRTAGASEVVAIPRRDVIRLEIGTKRHRRGRAAGIGALVGLGIGAVAGFAVGNSDCGGPDAPTIVCVPREGSAVGVGVAGAGLGAALGLLFAPGETVWETVDPGGLQVSVIPSRRGKNGLGLALSLTF
jgi:hypothetical protein